MLERYRKNPKKEDEFVKICDRCNKAYLERMLLMPFWKNVQRIKVVVEDREKIHDRLTEKLNKVETEIVNIKQLVGYPQQNGTKEADLEQRNNKLNETEKDLTTEMEDLKEEMSELSKKLSRIDYEFIQAEMQIREHRAMHQRLEKEYKDYSANSEKLDNEIVALVSKMNQYEMDFKVRSSHIGQSRMLGESLFGNRLPTIIAQNRSLIGGSVLPNQKNKLAARLSKNTEVKASRGFCSVFGFGSEKKPSTKK